MSGSEQVLTIHPAATSREIAAVLAVVAGLSAGVGEDEQPIPERPAWANSFRPTAGRRAETSGWRRSAHQFHV